MPWPQDKAHASLYRFAFDTSDRDFHVLGIAIEAEQPRSRIKREMQGLILQLSFPRVEP